MKRNRIIIATIIFMFCMINGIYAFYHVKNGSILKFISEIENTDTGTSISQRQVINDKITQSRSSLITETVKNVSPAVVGITVTEIRQYQDPWASLWSDDPFWRQFFGDRSYKQEVKMLGSGSIISPDGYILTNDHVAGNGVKIVVSMTNGKHYDAKIIGSDPVSDICLLKIDATNLPHFTIGTSSDVIIGEWVIALGNPFGLFEINDQPTVTVGVISAQGMNLDPINNRYYLNMLQTDAAINSGNSGGPLVNSLGQLIGMNTLIVSPGGSQGSIGLGFAIPIDKVKRIADELKRNGKIDRDFWIGLGVQNIDESIANYYKLASSRGVIVTRVENNSPAAKAGIEVGDIILRIDNNKITNDQSLVGAFQEFRTGQTIKVEIIRENETSIKQMKLERKK